MILDVNQPGTKKVHVCGVYREYMSSVSGLDSIESKQERMDRMFELWNAKLQNKDSLIAGDMNIDWKKINDSDYHMKPLANKLMDFILEENLTQINEEYTREERYNNEVKRSNIDHFYMNIPEMFDSITSEYLSGSDHKIIKCRKKYKNKEKKNNCTRKRIYKRFILEDFLNEINESNINRETTKTCCINKASEAFNREYLKILEKHAKKFRFARGGDWLVVHYLSFLFSY